MNTVFLLMAEYETSQIPLSVVAEKFLSISPSWADKKANLGELPFPTYRDNQKSGRLVHIVDLAEWIDKKRELAKIEFKSLQ
ncbi:TPA: pyocin activator PrtN family protein [Proteus mirabilis]|uniref:Pyocin activator protein PrtN n=1 Tax=Proteus vulgaris TaxID=585 RepID=A0A379FAM8_PROVU|nr:MULTISPECIES: pyocin activator PrtN family protein [Proteus]MBG3049512.1 pyocin activator PrtN family protein [Proteus mirabilis]MBG3116536.1 pyocin activator PrtN family protein [Proteus mirabilis]MBI6302308.1 pyocin activator PrtN family protein [Proteus mirabilis]MBJ2110885.1 pyocin activator PrtN family protein [Proteus terrae]MBJ2134517.1 pyocin activator PrtN family protein [Proteus terrae]